MRAVRQEPMMIIGSALNVAVVLTAVFIPALLGSRLTQDQMAAVSVISTAATSAIAAFLVSPVSLGAVNAAVSTALVATAAFGLHFSPGSIAVVTGSLTTVLSYFMREKVTPVVSQGG